MMLLALLACVGEPDDTDPIDYEAQLGEAWCEAYRDCTNFEAECDPEQRTCGGEPDAMAACALDLLSGEYGCYASGDPALSPTCLEACR